MEVKTKSYEQQLQELVDTYREAGETWPTDSKTIASWLIRTRRWEPTRKSAIDILAPQLSAAMRHQLFQDPQGRNVRQKHAVRKTIELSDGTHKQAVFWIDFDDITREEMHESAQWRRSQILGDCIHLKTDVDSFNENRNPGPEIQLYWDFTDDILESEQPGEYEA